MTAIDKTRNLLRVDLPLALLEKNPDNPNKMGPREFDLLVDNMQKTGFSDPILAHPLDFGATVALLKKVGKEEFPAAAEAAGLKFRIDGGHHRFDGASFLGFEVAPCTIILDPEFTEDQATFQLVRMNAIRGKLDPQAFFNLYQKMSSIYADEVLQESFGFAEEAEFKRLIAQTAKGIKDPVMKQKFKDAAEEIKTIDELSALLNRLFTQYGDTLPYGFMAFEYGKQRSMWLRVDKKTMNSLDVLGTFCIDHQRTIDDIVGGLVRMAAKGDLADQLKGLVEGSPAVKIPAGFPVAPTANNLEKSGA